MARTWGELFSLIAPFLMTNPHETTAKELVTGALFAVSGHTGSMVTIDEQDFQTLKIQFMALRLITVNYAAASGGGWGLFWNLTPLGNKLMVEMRAVRSKK